MNSAPAPQAEIPCLISADELNRRCTELARQITADYQGKDLIVVGVLKGAFVFLADLMRRLAMPVRCDFVKISSYGLDQTSSGQVRLDLDLTIPITARHVLIVEDIIDTGISTAWLIEHLRRQQPASLRVCALLDKPARRQTLVPIAYCGFTIPDRFVVGYGIDCAEQYRQLPYVGFLPFGDQNHASTEPRSAGQCPASAATPHSCRSGPGSG